MLFDFIMRHSRPVTVGLVVLGVFAGCGLAGAPALALCGVAVLVTILLFRGGGSPTPYTFAAYGFLLFAVPMLVVFGIRRIDWSTLLITFSLWLG